MSARPRTKQLSGWEDLGYFGDKHDWLHSVCDQVTTVSAGFNGTPEFCTYCGMDSRRKPLRSPAGDDDFYLDDDPNYYGD